MARKPRVHISGGLYHVMLRGNCGQQIFFSDEDRLYLGRLVDGRGEEARLGGHQHKTGLEARLPVGAIKAEIIWLQNII